MDIQDKVVIVTGASAGIGLATAELFAQRGAKVALTARSVDKLSELSKQLPGSLAVPVDMRDSTAIQQMIDQVAEHYGRIDVLINNAGQGLYGPLEGIDLDLYRSIMELNVFGPLVAIQAVLPIMRRQGGGVIINISSGLSKMYQPNVAAYASTKHALNAMTLTLRTELASDNIRVGVMYPGLTATDFGKNSANNPAGGSRPAPGYPGARPNLPPRDTPEMVAAKILEAVQTEVAEQYMSDEQRQRLNQSS